MNLEKTLTAFAGMELLAAGAPQQVANAVRAALAASDTRTILVFDDETGQQIDLDLRPTGPAPGSESLPDETRKAGRPRLGVVSREVTLLPRHWDWLAAQPGGASVTLRKLVEAARKSEAGAGAVRRAREATDRFMSAMLGNQTGYEDAARALYAGDRDRFLVLTENWPAAPRAYLLRLADDAFAGPQPGGAS
jgi:hypothetical protein